MKALSLDRLDGVSRIDIYIYNDVRRAFTSTVGILPQVARPKQTSTLRDLAGVHSNDQNPTFGGDGRGKFLDTRIPTTFGVKFEDATFSAGGASTEFLTSKRNDRALGKLETHQPH